MKELAAANESVRRCIQIVEQAEKIDGVTVDQLTRFSEQCSELFGLLDDNYQNFCQDMEAVERFYSLKKNFKQENLKIKKASSNLLSRKRAVSSA